MQQRIEAMETMLREQQTKWEQERRILQERENCLRLILNRTYDWEYWRGSNGKFRYMSPSCERITGYRVDEFLTDLLIEITYPEHHSSGHGLCSGAIYHSEEVLVHNMLQ